MDSLLSSITLILPLLLLLLLLHHSSATTATFPAPIATNPFSFIRSSCSATLYPDLCYDSLSRYADAVHQDPAHLARVAIGVTLVRARLASARLYNLTQQADYGPDPRAASALHDCRSTFSDAIAQMHQSLRQMRQLGLGPGFGPGYGSEEVRFRLSNVQTWMSAALTNEDTCSDGFDDVAEGEMKEEVCQWVGDVRELNSNALALVNTFAASLTS